MFSNKTLNKLTNTNVDLHVVAIVKALVEVPDMVDEERKSSCPNALLDVVSARPNNPAGKRR